MSEEVTAPAEETAQQSETTEAEIKRPSKEGSTRLPPFPMVHIVKPKVGRKPRIYYNQVPELRKEMRDRLFKIDKTEKYGHDFKRTSQDFWRMELDRMNHISNENKKNMAAAAQVYLGQTQGSHRAISGLVKHIYA